MLMEAPNEETQEDKAKQETVKWLRTAKLLNYKGSNKDPSFEEDVLISKFKKGTNNPSEKVLPCRLTRTGEYKVFDIGFRLATHPMCLGIKGIQ